VKSVRAAYVVTLSMIVLAATAAPAMAASGSGSVVLADDQFKWFYWIGILLAASMAFWLLFTAVMYYVRVIRPKHRGRETS
jgi:hypothetical protein